MADGFAQEPQIVSATKLFTRPHGVQDAGRNIENNPSGITLDGSLSWMVTNSGYCLEVWDTSKGRSYSSWSSTNFGTITCVVDIVPRDSARLFLVGLSKEDGTGGLVVVNPAAGAAVRWVPLLFAVSAIHCLSTGPRVPNIDKLKSFKGVAAVGGRGGNLMLIDLQLDQLQKFPPDIRPKTLANMNNVNTRVEQIAVDANSVFAIDLTEEHRGDIKFSYCNSDASKTLLMEVENSKAYVTAIHYVPQLLTLFIGYNFGGFQLYNLRISDIVCTSRVDNPTTLESVTHVAYQEPDDDPRLYIYLWVVYGSSPFEYKESGRSRVVLYQLNYQDRDKSDELGFIYRHLQGCMPRFEHLLGLSPKHAQVGSHGNQGVKTRVIFCKTLSHLRKQKRVNHDDNKIVNCGNSTLAAFGWTAQKPDDPSSLRSYVGLFDLNQWYHSQMPLKVFWKKKGPGARIPLLGCEFFAFFSLVDNHGCIRGNRAQTILSCQVKNLLFLHTPPPCPETHMWPSSLSFDTEVLLPEGTTRMTFCGLQRTVYQELWEMGPSALSDMQSLSRLFAKARTADLLPIAELDERTVNDPKIMRTGLLDVLLEYGALSVIESCIDEWSDRGTDPDGCTLPFLLEWASIKLSKVITEKERNCKELYDKRDSGDWLTIAHLRHEVAMFDDLAQVFNKLFSVSQSMLEERGVGNTIEGEGDLLSRALAAEIHSKFTKVLLWSLSKELLPHCFAKHPLNHPRPSHIGRGKPIIGELVKAATQNSSAISEYPLDSFEVLLELHMDHLTESSLVDYVMMYYLYDVMSVNAWEEEEEGEQREDLVVSYQETFMLSSVERETVKGFWILDNLTDGAKRRVEEGLIARKAEEALQCLKDPTNVLFEDQHTLVLHSFMNIGVSKCALKYFECHKEHIHCDLLHQDSFEAVLTVLLNEDRLHQALELCRNYAGSEAEEDTYRLLLETSNKSRKLSHVISQELSHDETVFVWNYLNSECTSIEHKELLVLALTKWGYLDDAISLNDQIQRDLMGGELRERANSRRLLLEGLAACEPAVFRHVWRADRPEIKEVEVETLTAILGKTIQPRQVTTASLLEGIMISRAQGPKTPLLSRSRRSLATTPTLGSSDGTPLPSNLSVFGKKLMSSSTRTPSRTITEGESKKVLTPRRPTHDTTLPPSSVSRSSIASLKNRLSALKGSFTLPPDLCTPNLKTPISGAMVRQNSLGRPTPRSILKRVAGKPSPGGMGGGEEIQEMDATDSGIATKRITFAKSPSPTSSIRRTTLNSSAGTPISSGEDSFVDAVDQFPPDDSSSIAHQLKYGNDASLDLDKGMHERKPLSDDETSPVVPTQPPRTSQTSSIDESAGIGLLGRKALGDTESSSPILNLHVSDSESDFMESSFEKAGKEDPSPPSIGLFGQHSLRTSLERKSIFWEQKPREWASLDSPLFPKDLQTSGTSAREPPSLIPSSSRSYRFISQETREKMLGRASVLLSPMEVTPSSSHKVPVSSLTATGSSLSGYSFRPPLAKSPPPSEDKEFEAKQESSDTTPLKPYAFSPPFTRSATREKKASEFARTLGGLSASGTPLSTGTPLSAATPTSSTTKRTKRVQSRQKAGIPNDSTTDEDVTTSERGKGRQRRDVPSRSPVPVRRSKRLLTKK